MAYRQDLAPEFEAWLARIGLSDALGRLIDPAAGNPGIRRLMDYAKAS